MKKSIRILTTIICFVTASTVYGQWTTSGSNVSLSTTTNNVIVGPTPATPTNFHVNSNAIVGSSSNTNVTIENSATSAISKGAYLTFKNGSTTYSMGTNSFPAAESGMFHITNLIHTNGTQITFSDGYSKAYTGVYATSKYNFRNGLSAFDSIYAARISVNMLPATGYNFAAWGQSYFQGKVAIGISNLSLPATSTHKLYVGGSIICEEVLVKLQANWPDFVFSPSYKLRPLSEVKSYIAQNNHLPDVPAACEVEENGVATGEMLTIQMKKIEELTLYLIQMQEENEVLKKRIEALEVK